VSTSHRVVQQCAEPFREIWCNVQSKTFEYTTASQGISEKFHALKGYLTGPAMCTGGCLFVSSWLIAIWSARMAHRSQYGSAQPRPSQPGTSGMPSAPPAVTAFVTPDTNYHVQQRVYKPNAPPGPLPPMNCILTIPQGPGGMAMAGPLDNIAMGSTRASPRPGIAWISSQEVPCQRPESILTTRCIPRTR